MASLECLPPRMGHCNIWGLSIRPGPPHQPTSPKHELAWLLCLQKLHWTSQTLPPHQAVHFVLAISCNKQFRLKFSTFLILFPWNGILRSMVHTQQSLFPPFRNEGSWYVPESVLFMVLNFLPSILGNPHDHIWVFRWASLTRWCFYACAVVPAPQINTTLPDQMHG